jgi:hypothetical protein
MIAKILSFLLGSGASKAAGGLSTLTFIGSLAGAVLWLFGPGREWEITLNALELSGVALGASVVLEWLRRVPPPVDRFR